MIISRTPFRVSLFGGGSDYPAWYAQHGGAVLGFAIDKYCYVSVRKLPPFFDYRHRIVYSKVETVDDPAAIQHPAVRHVLQELNIDYGVEIHHDGDLPARAGLGSSSSFTVGLLHALHAQAGRMKSKHQLALEALHVEQDVIREHVGSQDQIWAAYGGMNRIDFQRDGAFNVSNIIMARERKVELFGHFMLFFTGFARYADEIAARKIANLDRKAALVHAMAAMVDEAQSILANTHRSLHEIGELLHHSWMMKRDLADTVTNPKIDAIYQAGLEAGALGGKLLGAGGGGFMLFFVPPERQSAVRERLRDLVRVRFDVDQNGSKIAVYEPEGLEHC
jgi:D-glycero-alpha-D-manno-heptose-7-phosphate kinase